MSINSNHLRRIIYFYRWSMKFPSAPESISAVRIKGFGQASQVKICEISQDKYLWCGSGCHSNNRDTHIQRLLFCFAEMSVAYLHGFSRCFWVSWLGSSITLVCVMLRDYAVLWQDQWDQIKTDFCLGKRVPLQGDRLVLVEKLLEVKLRSTDSETERVPCLIVNNWSPTSFPFTKCSNTLRKREKKLQRVELWCHVYSSR